MSGIRVTYFVLALVVVLMLIISAAQINEYKFRINEITQLSEQMSRTIDEFDIWARQQQFPSEELYEPPEYLFRDPFDQLPEENLAPYKTYNHNDI